MKQLSRFEMAAVKRTAQNTKMLVKKLDKIKSNIVELEQEKSDLESQIDDWEAPIFNKYGYKSDEIIAMGGIIPEDLVSSEDYTSQEDEVVEESTEVF